MPAGGLGKADGRSIINTRLPVETRAQLEELAAAHRRNMTAELVVLIEEAHKRMKREEQ